MKQPNLWSLTQIRSMLLSTTLRTASKVLKRERVRQNNPFQVLNNPFMLVLSNGCKQEPHSRPQPSTFGAIFAIRPIIHTNVRLIAMSSNQKRIRDLERMMKKFGNTPDLLAKLEAAKQSKGEVQVKEKMRKNSTKYHMVKFLERKKMTRSIRSVESKIKKEEDAGELAVLNKKRDKLLEDLAYIM